MTTEPLALKLANSIKWMDTFTDYQRDELDRAAAELRRLHAKNEVLRTEIMVLRVVLKNARSDAEDFGRVNFDEIDTALARTEEKT